MIDIFFKYAQQIGLLFFFTVFVGIIVWVLRPSKKIEFELLGNIPLKEDNNGK